MVRLPGAGPELPLTAALAERGFVVLGEGDVDLVVLVGTHEEVISACAEQGAARILAVVETTDRREATALLDSGASGVALREGGPRAIAAAAAGIAEGFVVVPEPARHAVRRPVLTARQKQILSLLVLGLSNGDIAARLFLSESTIKTHLTIIFSRLGVTSRKEATDLILDPASGLGTGILGIAEPHRVQTGYGRPQLGSR